MPRTPEEPQVHEHVPGPRTGAGTAPAPTAPRPAAPLPGPRSSPRPEPPRADRSKRPGPGRAGAVRAGTGPQPGPGTAAATGEAAAAPAATPVTAQIQLVEATEATAVETADDAVDQLLDEGRAPGEVLLLTTGEPHPWAQHEQSFGEDAYWRQLAEGEDVFCADAAVAGRIGRRDVVVLAVNGGTDAQAAQALPGALDRARSRLVVCGDPLRLRDLL